MHNNNKEIAVGGIGRECSKKGPCMEWHEQAPISRCACISAVISLALGPLELSGIASFLYVALPARVQRTID